MRCPKCGQENREGSKFCNKCKADLQMPLLPWKWHIKTLIIIYIILGIIYAIMKIFIK